MAPTEITQRVTCFLQYCVGGYEYG